jgi:hypothetical protein
VWILLHNIETDENKKGDHLVAFFYTTSFEINIPKDRAQG